MADPKNEKTTPLVEPFDASKERDTPRSVDVEAPRSTDEGGDDVALPDLGGRID